MANTDHFRAAQTLNNVFGLSAFNHNMFQTVVRGGQVQHEHMIRVLNCTYPRIIATRVDHSQVQRGNRSAAFLVTDVQTNQHFAWRMVSGTDPVPHPFSLFDGALDFPVGRTLAEFNAMRNVVVTRFDSAEENNGSQRRPPMRALRRAPTPLLVQQVNRETFFHMTAVNAQVLVLSFILYPKFLQKKLCIYPN